MTDQPTANAEGMKVKEYDTFDSMDLPEDVLRGVYAIGFEKPSPIQRVGIVPIKDGRDIIAQAQSGTGKTGTFVTGSLSRIDPSLKKPQVLCMVHTHELARQIAKVATILGNVMKLNVLCATGGSPVRDDIKALTSGAQFIVGTPGRIYDLMHRDVLLRDELRVLILDEADEMLQEMFYKQVMCILEKGFPVSCRVALFSATMPPEVIEVADKILQDPVRILIASGENVKLNGINNYFVSLDAPSMKSDCIYDLYKNLNISQAVIFCNTKRAVEQLGADMATHGFPVTCIHGEIEKGERKRKMNDFMCGSTRVMITTDLLARGIDVQQVSLVINYDVPEKKETYIHRSGRSGRFGRKGTTINLIVTGEESMLMEIADFYSISMTPLPSNLSTLL
jgi:translation initiation factor 4A